MRYAHLKNRLDRLKKEAESLGLETKIGIVQVADKGNLVVFNSEYKFEALGQIKKHLEEQQYTHLIIDAMGYYDYDSLIEQFKRTNDTKEEYEKNRSLIEEYMKRTGDTFEPTDSYTEETDYTT